MSESEIKKEIKNDRKQKREVSIKKSVFGSAFVFFVLLIVPKALMASNNYANPRAAAYSEFKKERYYQAIKSLKRHLRKAPKDYEAWHLYAAAYYHMGLPDKALKHLKLVIRFAALKSYNYYYQGLSYLALGKYDLAKRAWGKAAAFNDEYASRSIYEVGLLEYNQHNEKYARLWALAYIKRFPSGVYRSGAEQILRDLDQGKYFSTIQGSVKPDLDTALFKYNKWSLTPHPHYWFFQTGYLYDWGTNQNPERRGTGTVLKAGNFTNHKLKLNAGVGLGPYRQRNSTAFFGYNYYQDWEANNDRIEMYRQDPLDIRYIPFRGDLLVRHHQIYGDLKKSFQNRYHLGVLSAYEISKVGSSLFPEPQAEQTFRRVLNVSRIFLLVPWIGMEYGKFYETTAYLYFKNESNSENQELSNKSYNLLDDNEIAWSYGINQKLSLPHLSTFALLTAYSYTSIYNDYWLDKTRDGIAINLEHAFIDYITVFGSFGYFQDVYQLPRLKSGDCSFEGAGVDYPTIQPQVVYCKRADIGTSYQVGLTWQLSQFSHISGYFQRNEIKNRRMAVYDKTANAIYGTYTFAFPNIKRVAPFLQRYGSNAYTKEVN